ncbi:hematopoietic cell signal transducer [Polypterus senegalus]|uniref:hematopoietic cell signal transducer n=1 Tax=Polypterus senegalus TaxID=55291 RepID=UPI00196339FF|nr:hematopoietic cell signal transducer [Polypterus senegalus]
MTRGKVLLCFIVLLGASGADTGPSQAECGHCYKIDPGTMAGIIIGDIFITILIVISVYYCASQRKARMLRDEKVYMNMPNRDKWPNMKA